MGYTLIPSLEFIALVKITALLWNQADIRTIIFWFPFFSRDKLTNWHEVENSVIEKVSRLPLPKKLIKCVLGSVKPIGNQIFGWFDCHKNLYFGILDSPKEIFWTVQGILDSKRTAEALIQDKNLHIFTRYKLACIYCLQKDISELWQELPANLKKRAYDTKYSSEFVELEILVGVWTHEILGISFRNVIEEEWWWRCRPSFRSTASPYQHAIDASAEVCNKAAVEFFLQKLTPAERRESLARCTEYVAKIRPSANVLERYSNVMRLLMSELEEEEELQVYERYPRTLECLLEWPWQALFVEKVDRVRDFLSAEDYGYLLNVIVLKDKDGFQDWNYRHLFRHLWQKGTSPHKRYVLDECISGPLLTNLFEVKDMENITLVVQDATAAEKEEIVYYRPDLISLLIYNDGFNVLKLLVEHCEFSGDIISEFQREFLQRDITSLAKKDMREEKSVVRKFLKSLLNLFPKPRSAGGAFPHMPLIDVHWGKEEVRYISWKRLKIRQLPKQKQVFKMN